MRLEHYENPLVQTAVLAAQAAAEKIRVCYNSNVKVWIKEDNSPVTEADLMADHIINEILSSTGIPILSEENKSVFTETFSPETYWLVDPIDGTEEFVTRSGEFTVNIALMHQRKPILGVMAAPVANNHLEGVWVGIPGLGFFRQTNHSIEIPNYFEPTNPIKILASRRDLKGGAGDWIAQKFPANNFEMIWVGSSLKFLYLALGLANLYPRSSRLNTWDVAAGNALLIAAGGGISAMNLEEPFNYNKPIGNVSPFIASSKSMNL
jgi:3'(2'), 5'-bisphosphate nucleotidase